MVTVTVRVVVRKDEELRVKQRLWWDLWSWTLDSRPRRNLSIPVYPAAPAAGCSPLMPAVKTLVGVLAAQPSSSHATEDCVASRHQSHSTRFFFKVVLDDCNRPLNMWNIVFVALFHLLKKQMAQNSRSSPPPRFTNIVNLYRKLGYGRSSL